MEIIYTKLFIERKHIDMDKSKQFIKNREKYSTFLYNGYSISEDEYAIYLNYDFEIPALTKFNPKIKINKKKKNTRENPKE